MQKSTLETTPNRGAIPPGEASALAELVEYGEGAVVSRTLAKSPAGTLTVFAFDDGQELSEHTAPFDAFVLGLEGQATLSIEGQPTQVSPGEVVLMPARIPHAIHADERFKMLLTMFKG